MTALIIVIALFVLLMLVPLGVRVSYDSAGFEACAEVCKLCNLKLYPPRTKSPEQTAPESRKKEKVKGGFSIGFTLDEWLELAKATLRALRRFKNGISFGVIKLYCVISAEDPYDAVMRYNTVNAFVGSAIPFFENSFNVRSKELFVDLNLQSEVSVIEGKVEASVRLGRLIGIALSVGVIFLKLLVKNRIYRARERKSHNGKQQIERNDAVNDEQHQEPC